MTAKKIVHYTGTPQIIPGFAPGTQVAILRPHDHPDTDNVSNTMEARTSRIVRHDADTGEIETLNTLYRPLVIS